MAVLPGRAARGAPGARETRGVQAGTPWFQGGRVGGLDRWNAEFDRSPPRFVRSSADAFQAPEDVSKILRTEGTRSMAPSRRLRTIIVEDEESPRQLLKRLLERRHSDQIDVIAEAETGPDALLLCEKHQPDVLFLDLHLPGLNGMELLAQLRSETHVVITTADTQQAVEAYRANAVDYLLKPIDPEQLREAVTRVVSAIANERVVRLLCRDREDTKVVHTDDVLFIRADDGYTNVQTEDAYYLLTESLLALEDRLPPHFVRVHRTTIVNARHVTGLSKGNDFALLGRKGHDVAISRRHLREFRRKLMYVT